MHRVRPSTRSVTQRIGALVVAATLGFALVATTARPAAAASGQPGTKVAAAIASKWWPETRMLLTKIPGAKSLSLTRVRCPRRVPETVADPERAIARELARFGAADVAPAVSRTGVFSCTARLDGQTLLVVGAISPESDAHFATGSLILAPDEIASRVADAYAQRIGTPTQAVCPGDTVLVAQPDDPIGCRARDVATEQAVVVEVRVDGDLNTTFSFPG